MAQAVRTFEGKHEYTHLPALQAARGAGGGAGAPRGTAPRVPSSTTSRSWSSTVTTISTSSPAGWRRCPPTWPRCRPSLAGLVRVIREDSAQVQRLTWRLRGDITRSRHGSHRPAVRPLCPPGAGARAGRRQDGGPRAGGRGRRSSTTPSSSRSPTPCCTSCRTPCSTASSPRPSASGEASPSTAPCLSAPTTRAARCTWRWRTTGAASMRIGSGQCRPGRFLDAVAAAGLSEREGPRPRFPTGFQHRGGGDVRGGTRRGHGRRPNQYPPARRRDRPRDRGGNRYPLHSQAAPHCPHRRGAGGASRSGGARHSGGRDPRPVLRTPGGDPDGPDGETVEIEGQELR